jgi:hypothetical protein
VIRKRCSRTQLLAFTANLQVQLIGMEACSGAHFLGRALREQGHEVRLMPAQYVKPYVQTNKSDYLDAEAIAEAVHKFGELSAKRPVRRLELSSAWPLSSLWQSVSAAISCTDRPTAQAYWVAKMHRGHTKPFDRT